MSDAQSRRQYSGTSMQYKGGSVAMSIEELALPRMIKGRNKSIEENNRKRLMKAGLIDEKGNWKEPAMSVLTKL